MSNDLYDYSGYLTFSIEPDMVPKLEEMARDVLGAIQVAISPTGLEIEYAGRDAGRKVVRFLHQIAPLIGDAEGDIECRLSDDTGDGKFEFYTIQDGHLYRQRAHILKQKRESVHLDEPLPASNRPRAHQEAA